MSRLVGNKVFFSEHSSDCTFVKLTNKKVAHRERNINNLCVRCVCARVCVCYYSKRIIVNTRICVYLE